MSTTKVNLSALFLARCQAYESLPLGGRAISELTPEERALADKNSATFRKTDAAIVAELKRLKAPQSVVINGKTAKLHLTGDGLSFFAADAKTGRPVSWTARHGFRAFSAGMLRGMLRAVAS